MHLNYRTWACAHLKTSTLSGDNFKKLLDHDGHLSLQYGQVILVSGYPVLTTVNWSQHGCAISGCTWALKVVRKCEIKHWFPCGADGRSFGWSVYSHMIAKFSGMDRFFYAWCYAARALRARELRYYTSRFFQLSSYSWTAIPNFWTISNNPPAD